MAKIVGQESPSKNTQILYRRSRKVSNAISTAVNIHSSRNHRARFALDRKIRRDNKRLGRSTIMVDDHRVLGSGKFWERPVLYFALVLDPSSFLLNLFSIFCIVPLMRL